MSEYILYATPGTCARVPMAALEEAEVSFEVRLVRLMTGEQGAPEYLALNPKGKVPVLLVDGVPLAENVAIVSFLADQFPDAQILPQMNSDLERYQVMGDLCLFSATIHPIVTRIGFPQRFVDGAEAQASVHQKSIEALMPSIALAEQRLSENEWWYGEECSALDTYLSWVWSRIVPNGFPDAAYPACMDHAARMAHRPAVQRAAARELAMKQQLKAEGLASGPPPAKR